jgi:transcriptional regulator with XRE-family HTH domain
VIEHEADWERLRRLRKRSGLTQAEFGQRMGRSQAWVSSVERGDLVLDSISLLNRAARVLNVHPNDIVGRPYPATSPLEQRGHAAIRRMRRAIQCHDLSVPWAGEPGDIRTLRDDVARITLLRRQARYAHAGDAIPELLAELLSAARQSDARSAEAFHALLARTYQEADAVAHAFGYADLSSLAIERARWSAEHSGDPLRVAVADYLRVRELWSSSLWGEASSYIDSALRRVEDIGSPAALTVLGSLHLRAAITAARSYDAVQARAHLTEARTIAAHVPTSFDPYELTFTSINVDFHDVATSVDMADGVEAVRRAKSVRIPPGTPPSRVSHFHMDVARAWLYYGDHARALSCIELAERVAPQLVRNHPMAHTTVRSLLSKGRRGSRERLRRIADRMHIT